MAEPATQTAQAESTRLRFGDFELGARDSTLNEQTGAIALHATGVAGTLHGGKAALCYCRQLSADSLATLTTAGWFERATSVRHDRLILVLEAGASGQTAFFVEASISGERVLQRLERRAETTPARTAYVLDDIHTALVAAWKSGVDLVISPETVRILDNDRAQVSLALSMCLNPRPAVGFESSAQFQLAFLAALLLSGQADPAYLCIDRLRGPNKMLGVSLVRERMANLAEYVALVLVKALDEDPAQRYSSVSEFLAAYKEALKATADNLAFSALEAKGRDAPGMAAVFGELIQRYDENHQEIAGVGARLAPKNSTSYPTAYPPSQTVVSSQSPVGLPPMQAPEAVSGEKPLSPEVAALLAGPKYEVSKPRTNPWVAFAAGLLVIFVVFLVIALLAMTRT